MVAQTTDPRTSSQSWQRSLVWKKPEFSLEINSFLASLWLPECPGICSQGPLGLRWLTPASPLFLAYPPMQSEGKLPTPVKTTKAATHLPAVLRGLGAMHRSWRGQRYLEMSLYSSKIFQVSLAEAGPPKSHHKHDWGHQLDMQQQLGT